VIAVGGEKLQQVLDFIQRPSVPDRASKLLDTPGQQVGAEADRVGCRQKPPKCLAGDVGVSTQKLFVNISSIFCSRGDRSIECRQQTKRESLPEVD